LPSSSERENGRDGTPRSERQLELANEYAEVIVRKVHTRNGVRLEISAPKLDSRIQICPLELEALTWQTTETFSRFLSTPFGPEAEAEED
jgi:hypothetical protein